MSGSNAEMLALVSEIVELRLQLAEAQDQCVEMAVDAGELLAEIHDLRQELAAARRERETATTCLRCLAA